MIVFFISFQVLWCRNVGAKALRDCWLARRFWYLVMFVYTLEGPWILNVCMIVKLWSSFGSPQYPSPLCAYKLIKEVAQSQGDQTASCESPLLYVSL